MRNIFYLLVIIYFVFPIYTVSAINPPFFLTAGQEVTIPITTHTGSITTQLVHPTILKFTNKINGYNYIIGITPYPNGNSAYENPSVAFTNDLINYTEDNVSNPLVPPPSTGWNADPDLTYDPLRDRLLMYFTFYQTPEGEGYTILASNDGTNWNVVGKWYSGTTVWAIASPTVIYDPVDRVFKMWAIKYNRSTYEKTLVYATSVDGVNFSEFQPLNYTPPVYGGQNYRAWHIAVHKVGNEYWMIAAANPEGLRDGAPPVHLFFANSSDGINWTFYDTPILTTADSLATDKLYRADFVVENGTMHVLYSYRNSDGTWHIALTSVDVSGIVGNVNSDNVIPQKLLKITPETFKIKVKIFSLVNFSATLSSVSNCTWYMNENLVKIENLTLSPTLNLTFNESGFYNISLHFDGYVVTWKVDVYKPIPIFHITVPTSIEMGSQPNILVFLENLNELFDYEIHIDLDNNGIPDIKTKDLNITLPPFLRPAKYKITIYVIDPITNAVNSTSIYIQVYSPKLFKGYNVVNTSGIVVLSDSTEPVHAVVKPIKVSKEFTVLVSEENIYANKTSEVILNVTFIGLAGGDKVWLNETVVNAKTVDVLHNGVPLYISLPVKNNSINLTLTSFSTYTIIVNNTSPQTLSKEKSTLITSILILIVSMTMVLAVVAFLKKRFHQQTKMYGDFKFFRRVK